MTTITIGRHTIHATRPVLGNAVQCFAWQSEWSLLPVIRVACVPDRTNVLCWRDVPIDATEADLDAAIAALTADILTADDVREGRP